jgi:hypothetical protein
LGDLAAVLRAEAKGELERARRLRVARLELDVPGSGQAGASV